MIYFLIYYFITAIYMLVAYELIGGDKKKNELIFCNCFILNTFLFPILFIANIAALIVYLIKYFTKGKHSG